MKKEAYLVGHENCGIEVGDKVRIKRKAKDRELGWKNSWVEEMNIAVGKVGEVRSDKGECGFTLHFSNKAINGFVFPFFVLEKVKKEGGKKEMKTRVLWVSRDKDKVCDVLFWAKKPTLNEDGQWWGKGKNTEPDFTLDPSDVAHVFGVKLKSGEIKECRLEIVT